MDCPPSDTCVRVLLASLVLLQSYGMYVATYARIHTTHRLSERYQDASWFFFANEETQVDFGALCEVLSRYNPKEVTRWTLATVAVISVA